jgi:hypothetical protein
MRRSAVLPLAIALGCACSAPPAADRRGDLEVLASWIRGSFSSRAQHEAAPDDYYDVRLVVHPIWSERADGPWFYVEQATVASLAKPYRQRVIHLIAEAGALRADVYELPGDPLARAGAWREATPFGDLAPEQLVPRSGCALEIARDASGSFRGATSGRECPSDLRGAKYATAEIAVDSAGVSTWDRGFDAKGVQVWGATNGPYRFVKLASEPPP